MMVMPSMSKTSVKKIENMMREFLFNGQKAKIALHTLQNVKKEGGLNLVNLLNKYRALKAT